MLEFFAGLGAGTVACMALSVAIASRKDRRAREQMRRFAEMQDAAWEVQDFVAYCALHRAGSEAAESRRWSVFTTKCEARDRAAAAYFAAM